MFSGDEPNGKRHGQSRRRRSFDKLAGSDRSAENPAPATVPAPTGAPPATSPLIEQFRGGPQKHLRSHPLETTLLWLVAAHLIFLPWALGGMRLWAQGISFGLATLGSVVALLPREYDPEQTGVPPFRLLTWPKLFRFPVFWLGLALLGLVTLHGLNPAWEYTTDGKGWWMEAIPHIGWLPSGVRVPFERWGPWRMLMIYASAWMTVCTIWIGFTRRRTLQRLLIALVANGLVLATVGLAQRFVGNGKILGFVQPPPGAAFFGSFIYKNHAGAYLDILIAVTCALGCWFYFRGLRRMEKSNPGGIFVFLATVMSIAVVVSFARGATLTMLTYLVIGGSGFLIHQLFFAPKETRKPIVSIALVAIFVIFLKPGLEAVNTGEAWSRVRSGLADGGDVSFRSRLTANKASGEMLGDNWALGIGSGSYGFLFPTYQQKHPFIWTFDGTRRQFWWHAHNDWLEIPIELGLPGVLILGLSLGYFLLILVRNYFWANPFTSLAVLGLIAVALYSYWDFPFQCPSVLLLWCALWPATALWAQFEEQRAR